MHKSVTGVYKQRAPTPEAYFMPDSFFATIKTTGGNIDCLINNILKRLLIKLIVCGVKKLILLYLLFRYLNLRKLCVKQFPWVFSKKKHIPPGFNFL